jgi:hypothetical protein
MCLLPLPCERERGRGRAPDIGPASKGGIMATVEYISVSEAWIRQSSGQLTGKRVSRAYWRANGAQDYPAVWQDWQPYEFAFRPFVSMTIRGGGYDFSYGNTTEHVITYDTIAVLHED